jgi:hypothetical protein
VNTSQITVSRIRGATPSEQTRGLIAYLTLGIGGLRIDGVTVRRTEDGRRYLSFPERIDPRGQRRPLVWPLDDNARSSIETAVFRALAVQADSPR